MALDDFSDKLEKHTSLRIGFKKLLKKMKTETETATSTATATATATATEQSRNVSTFLLLLCDVM